MPGKHITASCPTARYGGRLLIGHIEFSTIEQGLMTSSAALMAGRIHQLAITTLHGDDMIKYAIIFAIISLISGALGYSGVAAGAAGIAQVLFGLFLILAVVFVVLAALGVGAVKKIMK